MCFIILYVLVYPALASAISSTDFPFLLPSKLQTRTSPEIQLQAAQEVIEKILPDFASVKEINPDLFHDEKDTFILKTEGDNPHRTLQIRASSGVAAVWGFHHYLKKYLNSHIGWQNQRTQVDYHDVPEANETVVANDRFRYYTNVCTHSYSFVWWNNTNWSEHISWMALNGINLVLAPLGQEEVWHRMYRELGLTDDEISEHFAGPAFLAWQRMGNLRGWGGPLPIRNHNITRTIQSEIITTMRSLGIIPVLPAFAGHVPRALTRIFPNAKFLQTAAWNKFSSDYCCPLFLDPTDSLFKKIGASFLRQSIILNGDSHVYSADPFNELRTENWSTNFVENVAVSILSSMTEADPRAVWVVQNWMFFKDSVLWPHDRVRSFLQALPRGRLLVLDLQSEQWPQYDVYEMYFGQPFIWCMLHNFGGTLGMFGDLRPINSEVYFARENSNSTMLGIGLTMEGINQNYMVYDLMLESAWRKGPIDDMDAWSAAYANRRYGCNETARGWRYLLRSVYAYPGVVRMRGKYVITRKPSLRIDPWAWYSSRDLMEAWGEFVRASYTCLSAGYLHDLVDVTRQALQYRAEQLYIKLIEQLQSRDVWSAEETTEAFLDIMMDMDEILQTSPNFSLLAWLASARSAAGAGDEVVNEVNAKNQITLWGPNGEIEDYACKQWAGMFKYYYVPRWRAFLSAAIGILREKGSIADWDERGVQAAVSENVTRNFMSTTFNDRNTNLINGNTAETARKLFMKWSIVPKLRDLPQVNWREKSRHASLADRDEDEATPIVVVVTSTTTL